MTNTNNTTETTATDFCGSSTFEWIYVDEDGDTVASFTGEQSAAREIGERMVHEGSHRDISLMYFVNGDWRTDTEWGA